MLTRCTVVSAKERTGAKSHKAVARFETCEKLKARVVYRGSENRTCTTDKPHNADTRDTGMLVPKNIGRCKRHASAPATRLLASKRIQSAANAI